MPNDALSLYVILYLINVNANPNDFKCCVDNI